MRQRQNKPATPTSTSRGESSGPAATERAQQAPRVGGDRQSRLGNQAVAEQARAEGSEKPKGRRPSQRAVVGGTSRPDQIRSGVHGALIGAAEIVVHATEDGKQTAARVPDGTAAEVLSTKGERLKVRVRSGDQNVEGWVDAAVFSDQPALTRDEEDTSKADDLVYSKFEGDHSPQAPTGKDTAQGAAGDCFLIASMAAVANASPATIEKAISYNAEKGSYTVRFYEEEGRNRYKPVDIEVDAWLPTAADNRKDPSYAGDQGGKLWPAILEKAYAKWKGGYDVIGEGGYGDQAMAELTGARSQSKNPSSMAEKDVVPYFEQARKDQKAIYAGVIDTAKSDTQTPFSGSGDGPLRGTLKHTHRWNHVKPGTVRVEDTKGKAGSARDQGQEGAKTGRLVGTNVASGNIDYKSNVTELAYKAGLGPADAKDLAVSFEYEGVVDVNKMLIGNHAYAFESVLPDGTLQFYNPWGTYQPKPVTASEFLKYFNSLSTNQPPAEKTAE